MESWSPQLTSETILGNALWLMQKEKDIFLISAYHPGELLYRLDELVYRRDQLIYYPDELLYRQDEILTRPDDILIRSDELLYRVDELLVYRPDDICFLYMVLKGRRRF